MIEEFSGLEGHVNSDMYPDVGLDGERMSKEKVIGIYKPAEEADYKGKKVLYVIVEEGDNSPGLYKGFIIVPGYRISDPYQKEEIFDIDMGEKLGDHKILYSPHKELACKVERIGEKEEKNIEKLIKRITGRDLHVNFW